MRRGEPDGCIDGNFPLALIDAADHGVQNDENGDEDRDHDVGNTAVVQCITGIVHQHAIRLAAEESQPETVHQMLGGFAGVGILGMTDGDPLQFPADG